MRGDLHTLKKICRYASKVMTAGSAIFILLIVVLLSLSLASVFSTDIDDTLSSFIRSMFGNGSTVAGILYLLCFFVMGFVTVYMIRGVMASILEDGSPFTEANVFRLKMISETILVGTVPITVLNYLAQSSLAMGICHFFALILVSVTVYCVSTAFRYGAELQNLSDHTL